MKTVLIVLAGLLIASAALGQQPPVIPQNGGTGVSNAAGSTITLGGALTTTAAGTAALLATKQQFTAPQAGCVTALSISTTTFTPDGTCNNYTILLTSACASAACTIANWSSVPTAGTSGVFRITQPGSGGPAAFGTYGSQYLSPGGTATITYSTAASAVDVWSWFSDGTHVFVVASLGFSH